VPSASVLLHADARQEPEHLTTAGDSEGVLLRLAVTRRKHNNDDRGEDPQSTMGDFDRIVLSDPPVSPPGVARYTPWVTLRLQ
jgi:hypothetical protein